MHVTAALSNLRVFNDFIGPNHILAPHQEADFTYGRVEGVLLIHHHGTKAFLF